MLFNGENKVSQNVWFAYRVWIRKSVLSPSGLEAQNYPCSNEIVQIQCKIMTIKGFYSGKKYYITKIHCIIEVLHEIWCGDSDIEKVVGVCYCLGFSSKREQHFNIGCFIKKVSNASPEKIRWFWPLIYLMNMKKTCLFPNRNITRGTS